MFLFSWIIVPIPCRRVSIYHLLYSSWLDDYHCWPFEAEFFYQYDHLQEIYDTFDECRFVSCSVFVQIDVATVVVVHICYIHSIR